MNGAQAFNYPMVESWGRLTGCHPSPWEVRALFTLDVAYRSGAIVEAKVPQGDDVAETPAPKMDRNSRPWPEKKQSPELHEVN